MTDQPYCRACTHFNEPSQWVQRCGHPKALVFDRVEGEVKPLIDGHVTSLCDIYNRFEPKGQ